MPPLAFSDIDGRPALRLDRALSEKIALAIDEYPYLRDVVKGMDSILQVLSTSIATVALSLILCGSYVEVMKSLLERDNPLYGRIDLKINLQPMDYYESAQFYPELPARTRFVSSACSAAFRTTTASLTRTHRFGRTSFT